MQPHLTVALLLTAVAVAPAAVSAQDVEPDTRIIIFDDMRIGGEREAPPEMIAVRQGAQFDTLIEIRRSFYDEIVESADEVLH